VRGRESPRKKRHGRLPSPGSTIEVKEPGLPDRELSSIAVRSRQDS
jgi:hypothetical protein